MSADYLAIARRVPRRTIEPAHAQEAQKAQEGGLSALNALFAHPNSAFVLRDWFEERAAIRQFEGGYSRDMAERLAYGELVEAWCESHPIAHDRWRCAGCGESLTGEALDLPDGARVHWERQREFACLISYGFMRKRRAPEALATLGLSPPLN